MAATGAATASAMMRAGVGQGGNEAAAAWRNAMAEANRVEAEGREK